MGVNRLHTLTRWPADPQKRIELAITDMVFAVTIRRLYTADYMGPQSLIHYEALTQIIRKADSVRREAMAEME
jgi:hypothetical protein